MVGIRNAGWAVSVGSDRRGGAVRTRLIGHPLANLRVLLAVALWCAGTSGIACPLCLGGFQQSESQQLVAVRSAVLAVPTGDTGRFRVIEVVKGEQPAGGVIEGGYPRTGHAFGVPGSNGKPLLLVHDEVLRTWTILGAIGADHLGWLRKVAAGKPVAQMSLEDWRLRAALVVPHLESREPLAAEIAYDELAAAPYLTLRTLKPRLAAPAIRKWVVDPELAPRAPLYLLLLGMAGNAQDAATLEQRLDAAWTRGDATNVGPMIAADLELRGAERMAWVDVKYMRDRRRSVRELEAALLALSVQGNAQGVVTRERVIQSYRTFIREHPEVAGFVARDLAAWQSWEAVPEYVALLKSSIPQQHPSRVAIALYLSQSPQRNSLGLSLPALVDPPTGVPPAPDAPRTQPTSLSVSSSASRLAGH